MTVIHCVIANLAPPNCGLHATPSLYRTFRLRIAGNGAPWPFWVGRAPAGSRALEPQEKSVAWGQLNGNRQENRTLAIQSRNPGGNLCDHRCGVDAERFNNLCVFRQA
jgi:hypothetical protein